MKISCTIYNCDQGNNLIYTKNSEQFPFSTDFRNSDMLTIPDPYQQGKLEPTAGKFFYVLWPSEYGVSIGAIAHFPSSRSDNHRAVWIHIPKSIIKNEQVADSLEELLCETQKICKTFENNFSKLDTLLDRDYVEHTPCLIEKCQTNSSAVKYYDGNHPQALYDIFHNLYQPEWFKKYNAICLVDKNEGIHHNPPVEDISNQPLKKYKLVRVNNIRKINALKDNIQILDEDNNPLQDFWLEENSAQSITLIKEPYEPNMQWLCVDCKLNNIKFSKQVCNDDFKVLNEGGQKIYDAKIKFNNKKLPERIDEDDFENKDKYITIDCDEYDHQNISLNKVLEVIKTHSKLNVTLKRKKETYSYEIPDAHNPQIKYNINVVTNEYVDSKFTPIAGYYVDDTKSKVLGKKYVLKYDKFAFLESWRFWLVCLIGALVFFFMGYKYGCSHKPRESQSSKAVADTTQIKKSVNPDETATVKSKDLPPVKACDYLDSSQKWNRNEMEKIDELKGLWDALNEYDFDKINNYQAKLMNSNKFQNLCKSIPTRAVEKPSQKFCSDGDIEITPEKYFNKIEQLSTSSPENQIVKKSNVKQKEKIKVGSEQEMPLYH